MLDDLRGIRRPPAGLPVRLGPVLCAVLLALSKEFEPRVVRVCPRGEPGRLVAKWKIVDARWSELFARAGLRKSFAIFLAPAEARATERGLDKSTTIEWRAGDPSRAIGGEVEWAGG